MIPSPASSRTGYYKTSWWDISQNFPVCCLSIFYPKCATAWTFAESRDEMCSPAHFFCQASPIWTRMNIRLARGMKPNFYEDCFYYTCCARCMICHDGHELNALKEEREQVPTGGIEIMEMELSSDDDDSDAGNFNTIPAQVLVPQSFPPPGYGFATSYQPQP